MPTRYRCPPHAAQEEAEDLIDDHDVLPDAAGPSQHQASYRMLSRDQEEKTEEELARYIEDRYKQYDGDGDGGDDAADAGIVGQQGLLPTLNDPKLWMVHCRPGREREACVQLLQKFYTMRERGTPLMIKSAISLDHLKVRERAMQPMHACRLCRVTRLPALSLTAASRLVLHADHRVISTWRLRRKRT